MSKRIKAPPAARFRIGDKVRVRHGVMENDYPDMPIGGWAGEAHYEHLSKHLAFPFTAEFGGEYEHSERVKVIGLGDPDEPMIDDTYGILCEARIEGRVVTLPLGKLDDVKGKPNRQLIADYCYWLHNFA